MPIKTVIQGSTFKVQKNVGFVFASLIFIFSFFLPAVAHAFDNHKPFDISADLIDYTDADQLIVADGHVVITQDTSTLTADHVEYLRQEKHLLAHGHVLLHDRGSLMAGDVLDYDLVKQTGSMNNALGFAAPWLLRGESWEKRLDYYVGRQVNFTSCDLVDPHYHIRSSRMHFVPDEHFWAWNNLGYVDTLPVIYSPFIYKNLGPQRVVVQFQPGHDDVNGDFVKTVTTVRFTDLVYDKVLWDHYSVIGNGLGNELDYSNPNKLKGSLFGYYINPQANPDLAGAPQTPQYNIRSYHWQQLTPTTNLQSNVNLRNNVSFNNQYFPQDTNQAVSDVDSSIAVTQQKPHYNQRVVVERLDAPDPTDTSAFPATHIQTASLPRYDFTAYQIPLWKHASSTSTMSGLALGVHASSGVAVSSGVALSSGSLESGTTTAAWHPAAYKSEGIGPLMFSANATAGDTYERIDNQTHPAANGSFTLSESVPMGRYFTFSPNVTPQLKWQEKIDLLTPPAVSATQAPPPVSTSPLSTIGFFRGYQGRLGTSDNLRWRPLSAFSLDQTYTLVERMAADSFSLDRDGQQDGGVETHHVGWLAFWRPSRQILVRSFSGYDLRRLSDEDPNAFRQRRIDPWTSEVTIDPSHKTELFFRYAMGYFPTRDELWESDYRFNGPFGTRIETGLLYNNGQQGLLTWNNRIGFFFSPGWRVDATFHNFVPDTGFVGVTQQGTFIDSEFIITRDLHCWQAQFVYRNLPPLSRSYSLLFNLKLGVQQQKDITNPDLESQFYPWRARTYAN